MQILCKVKDEFLVNDTPVIGADYNTILLCNDKWLTFQSATTKIILMHRTFLTVYGTLNRLLEGTIKYPVMVKPRFGMGTIAVFEVEDEQELLLYATVSSKIARKGFLKDSLPAELNDIVIFQEKVSGTEYTLDVVNDLDGNYQTTFTKKKLDAING